MPGGSGGYYPGVDPDGKTPGGLIVAGDITAHNVIATELAATQLSGYETTSLTIAPGDFSWLTFDTIVYDPAQKANLSGSGVAITEPGVYVASMQLRAATSDTGNIELGIRLGQNGQIGDGDSTEAMANNQRFLTLFTCGFTNIGNVQLVRGFIQSDLTLDDVVIDLAFLSVCRLG